MRTEVISSITAPVEKIRAGDTLLFQVFREAKPGMADITPVNLDGYVLKVRKREGREYGQKTVQ